jgi:hypothetical protein
LALRSYGDRFLTRHRAAKDNCEANARIVASSGRETELEPMWLGYLQRKEADFKKERAGDYARFLQHRKERRAEIETSPWRLVSLDQALAYFDSDRERLRAFQEFFFQEILNFRQWDDKHNRQPPEKVL